MNTDAPAALRVHKGHAERAVALLIRRAGRRARARGAGVRARPDEAAGHGRARCRDAGPPRAAEPHAGPPARVRRRRAAAPGAEARASRTALQPCVISRVSARVNVMTNFGLRSGAVLCQHCRDLEQSVCCLPVGLKHHHGLWLSGSAKGMPCCCRCTVCMQGARVDVCHFMQAAHAG